MALSLKEKLAGIIPKLREERKEILTKHGDKKISDVNVAQAWRQRNDLRHVRC